MNIIKQIILISILNTVFCLFPIYGQVFIAPMIGVDLNKVTSQDQLQNSNTLNSLNAGFTYFSPTWGVKMSHELDDNLYLNLLLKYSLKELNIFLYGIIPFAYKINYYTISISSNYQVKHLYFGLGGDLNLMDFTSYWSRYSTLKIFKGIAIRFSAGYVINDFLIQLGYIYEFSNEITGEFQYLGPFQTFNLSVGYQFKLNQK